MYNQQMKTALTIIAISISLVGFVPYIKDSIAGKTKPHIVSWFIWALISFLAFGIQLLNDGGAGSYINLILGITCTISLIIGLRNGTKDISKFDILSLLLALVAIVLWLIVKQPLWSIILVSVIDLISFLPTVRKSWNSPWSETLISWELSVLKHVITLFTFQKISLIVLVYPVYALIANGAFSLMLVLRRRVVKSNS